jgi:mono/diheme cytochrome c family protein
MVNRAFALTIGLLTALVPAAASAQTNIDEGKSASQIFANACAECHKSASGLGKGKNSATVAEFLREHYTTGPQQAAALAAYVVGGRDSVASPTAGRKPPPDRASASTTEAPQDKRHLQRPLKPEDAATANAKPRRPGEADGKPKEEANSPSGLPSLFNPVARPEPGQNRPAVATRNRRKEPVAPSTEPPQEPAQEPADVAHEPAMAAPEPVRQETPPAAEAPAAATPTAAAPMETPSGESGEAVPRDNIPD